MIAVNRLRKTLCILLPVLIGLLAISVNAQEGNEPSSAEVLDLEPQGLETASALENDTDSMAEVGQLVVEEQPATSVVESETITDIVQRLWSQCKEYVGDPLVICVMLTAILTFVVYLWQLFFGVPDSIMATQEVKEKNEEITEYDEGRNVETQQGIADDVAIELAVQVWRLEKRVGQLDLNDSPKLLRRMADSVDKFKQLLQNSNVVVDDPVNRKYVDGWLEVKAIAWEEVPLEKCPDNIGTDAFVLETIRPIVRREGRPISIGRIVVAECEGKKII